MYMYACVHCIYIEEEPFSLSLSFNKVRWTCENPQIFSRDYVCVYVHTHTRARARERHDIVSARRKGWEY